MVAYHPPDHAERVRPAHQGESEAGITVGQPADAADADAVSRLFDTAETTFGGVNAGRGCPRRFANAVPLERLGTPADIASVVAFLASPAPPQRTAAALGQQAGRSEEAVECPHVGVCVRLLRGRIVRGGKVRQARHPTARTNRSCAVPHAATVMPVASNIPARGRNRSLIMPPGRASWAFVLGSCSVPGSRWPG